MSINADRPNGFTPIGTMSGSPWSGYIRVYEADTDASDIFVGDAVKLEADGQIDVAGAGDVVLGVCVGALNQFPALVNGQMSHSLSSTSPTLHPSYSSAKGLIAVCIGPDVLYEVQEDGDTDPIEIIDIGTNVDLIATHSGSTTTGRSGQEIDSSSSTAATAQFRIVNIVDRPDNQQGDIDTTKPNARWIVRINESHFSVVDTTTSATIGATGI